MSHTHEYSEAESWDKFAKDSVKSGKRATKRSVTRTGNPEKRYRPDSRKQKPSSTRAHATETTTTTTTTVTSRRVKKGNVKALSAILVKRARTWCKELRGIFAEEKTPLTIRICLCVVLAYYSCAERTKYKPMTKRAVVCVMQSAALQYTKQYHPDKYDALKPSIIHTICLAAVFGNMEKERVTLRALATKDRHSVVLKSVVNQTSTAGPKQADHIALHGGLPSSHTVHSDDASSTASHHHYPTTSSTASSSPRHYQHKSIKGGYYCPDEMPQDCQNKHKQLKKKESQEFVKNAVRHLS